MIVEHQLAPWSYIRWNVLAFRRDSFLNHLFILTALHLLERPAKESSKESLPTQTVSQKLLKPLETLITEIKLS